MKIVREQLYEKFKETSDPIKDMGIGMKKIWRKQAKSFLNNMYGNVGRIGAVYFGNKNHEGYAYILYGFFKKILEDEEDPQDAFYKSCENENFYGDRPDIVKERKMIADVIKKRFNIDVDPIDSRFSK